ncbi:hemicentin-1-like [Arctopsyche grandis]|uniref:hemicentin-1-like n=1 Tax=Arctopsyche grandis TaxID=121162 RepID=UPI00406D7B0D
MTRSSMFNFVMLFLLASIGFSLVAADDELAVLVGDTATLTCPISTTCGAVHSVRWYRDNERIAILADTSNFVKVEGKMIGRVKVNLSSLKDLKISPVQLDDEDQYKCDLTFLEQIEGCETTHIFQLKTLLKPKSLNIFDQNAKELHNGSPLNNLVEGTETTIECRADGGKPIPTLTWTIGDKEVDGDVKTTGEGEDAVTTNRLIFPVERYLQGKQIRCTVTSEALTDPMESNILLDLILFPIALSISGVEHHAVEGSKVTLECLSKGARPAIEIMWLNDTQIILPNYTLTASIPQSDETFDTTSSFSFWASRSEHNRTFTCESVQRAVPLDQQNVLNASHILDVHFPPVVSVRPDNIIVNETMDAQLFCEYEANPIRLLSVKWLQNNVELDLESDPDHYEGSDTEEPALLIRNTSEDDIGNYSCKLENAVGSSISPDTIFLDVHFIPEVKLTMDPDYYVIESSKQNITLWCNIVKGNPSTLLQVEWYLDQEFLITTPNCNKSDDNFSDDMCTDVEPNRLLLEEAGRSFHGNYSCRGKTLAGWGQRSNDSELIIHYEPGAASLIYAPQKVIKGGSVKLTCSVDDYGRPPSTRYQWYRGTQLISDIVTPDWIIIPVSLETETNFTCQAVNLAGMGKPAIVYVEVLAPPTFITNLTGYYGMMYNSSDISLVCRIECSPLCQIGWMKDGKTIEVSDSDQDLYTISNTVIASDSANNYFESMQSVLIFNMSNWPDQVLNRLSNDSNYSCFSVDNGVGPVITSTTMLGVEFPPENMTVSNKIVSVNEDEIPEKITCSAKGKPEPTYIWKRYISGNDNENENIQNQEEILSQSHTLLLEKGVKRSDSGDIVCEAQNVHGKIETTINLNVMYEPSCVITQTKIDDEQVLICTASANPEDVDFEWSMEDTNDTIDDNAVTKQHMKSILKLEQLTMDENPRNFVCIVNNTVGDSEPCTLIAQGILPWWKWWSRTALIVAAGVGILLILVILLCLIILCICRRKRAASKSPMNGAADGAAQGVDNPGVYENLPFHGLQQAPNKPYRPEINDQLIYADADLKDYGPINYKQASIYARMKKIKEQQKIEFDRKDE